MTHKTLRLGLMAGAAAALMFTGAASAQSTSVSASATASGGAQTVERRVVVMNGGPGDMAGENMMFLEGGGDIEQHVTVGPNGERQVVIIRRDGPGGPEDEAMGPGMGGHGMGPHHKYDPVEHASHLRDILQLRADQEPALQAFVTASAPPEKPPEMPDPEAIAKMTTPERLDWMSARMAEHQAMFQKRADAVKKFYAQLSPAQKKAFEAAHLGEMGMGPGGMRFRFERHGGPGMEGPGGPGMRHHGGPGGEGPPPPEGDGAKPPPGK